ncbi:hypothetical protein L3Q82_013879 [Scortum barcoo]|uniref:Uncharacterized protein n=1 Tax=Scortum barcoo TaxID=214431 RepID=A0ACB8VY64_9TELE|nr:hypothetical protein L3Q82_013879 [Scortum barcoo]
MSSVEADYKIYVHKSAAEVTDNGWMCHINDTKGVLRVKENDPRDSKAPLRRYSLSLLSDLSDDIHLSVFSPGADMEQRKCTILFLTLAVIVDIAGLVLFFVGIFAPLSFWDFFVLSGPLLIFLSLVFWIFWYLGNITVSEEELDLKKVDIL